MKNAKNNGIYTLIAKNDFGSDEKTVKADFMVGSAAVSGELVISHSDCELLYIRSFCLGQLFNYMTFCHTITIVKLTQLF